MVEAFAAADPGIRVWLTETTRDLVRRQDRERDGQQSDLRRRLLNEATLVDPQRPSVLELGGLTARIHPRAGHTPSDLTVELEKSEIVFCGDLIWNRFFPNFRVTLPTPLKQSVGDVGRLRAKTWVPGHGPLARGPDVERFEMLLGAIEAAARRGHQAGLSPEEAARSFRLPETVAEWHLFRDTYVEVAVSAWYRELDR